MAAALITCTRGEVATLVKRILSVTPGDGLQAWHAVTQWFKPRSVVEQAASMARLISPKRTMNVNELQLAVMQWELTLVEHESKFSEVVADSVKTAAMRAMLPKDILERFLDGPFHLLFTFFFKKKKLFTFYVFRLFLLDVHAVMSTSARVRDT